ncbi:MAG: GtrA family protein [Chloroflexi bacterium]|nr:GtrA family protein [Chloroflexota bacterium]
MLIRNQRERSRFIKFSVVGGIGTLVDFGTFNLLTSFLLVQPVISSVFSFLAALINNFILNRYWTYPDSRTKPIMRQIFEFGVVNLIGLAIRTPIFILLEKPSIEFFNKYNISGGLEVDQLGYNFSLAVAIGVVVFWNFFVNRYWTFGDVD